MALATGTRFGDYEILAPIGAGGMGEVYRARDTKLKRDVALKVLPDAFSRDPGRLARFQREAEVLASLNHPNIAHIYGVEERALVMEFVEGESPKGPLPFEEAWKIALQIADALEYAHERGVIHRDLKPANVKVTPDGVVKLLDFGLAKAFSETPDAASLDPENSPTVTLGATVAGTVMGTAAYMSPEQAKGKRVDKRADIWSWGVVLYELLTGERVFKGEDAADTLAAVIHKEPDLSRVPGKARKLLQRCLEKDPKQRLRDIGEGRFLVDEPPAAPPPSRLGWIATAVCALIAGVLGFLHFREAPPESPVIRSSILPPEESNGFVLDFNFGGTAISPDGRMLAFVADVNGKPMLFVRSLDSSSARMLPGTEGASRPFWSPNSRNIGFAARGKLKSAEVAEGAPRDICDIPGIMNGATWNQDGVIVVAGNIGGLNRVLASGGTLEPIMTDSDQAEGDLWPQFLPDGKHYLYLARGHERRVVYAASLEDAPRASHRVRLMESQYGAVYAPNSADPQTGYLLFLRGTSLVAQAFNPRTLALIGETESVAEDPGTAGISELNAYLDVSASRTGLLAYGPSRQASRRLVWFRRDGTKLASASDSGPWGEFRISPDGRSVAVGRRDSNGRSDHWMIDLTRGGLQKLTFTGDVFPTPAWSPDSRMIVYANAKGLFQSSIDKTGPPALLLAGPNGNVGDWSDDGKFVLYGTVGSSGVELRAIAVGASGESGKKDRSYITVSSGTNDTTGRGRSNPRFSPRSIVPRRVAYQSDESGTMQVYVREFPDGGRSRPVSVDGGQSPVWSRDGKELFYVGPTNVMSVAITTAAGGFVLGKPERLFDTPANFSGFDVSRDGRRFLFSVPDEQNQRLAPITLVQNWQVALKK